MNGLACVARRTILVVWVDEGGLGFSCSEDARDWCQWAMLGAVLNLGHVDWLVLFQTADWVPKSSSQYITPPNALSDVISAE